MLALLATLVVLRGLPIVLREEIGAGHFLIVAVLLMAVIGLMTTRHRPRRRRPEIGIAIAGACSLATLGAIELARFAAESDSGGFRVQMRSMQGDDWSAWLWLIGRFGWDDTYQGSNGYGVVVLLGLTSGILRATTFIHRQEYGTIGFSTLAASAAFSILSLSISVVCMVAYRRLLGVRARIRIPIVIAVGAVLLDFLNVARDMGHLTAALAAITLVVVLISFEGPSLERRTSSSSIPFLVALVGASLLWLPMALVGTYAALFSAWRIIKSGAINKLHVQVLAGVGVVGWFFFRPLLGRAETLFTTGGGARSASPTMIATSIALFVLTLAVRKRGTNLIGPMLLAAAAATVLLGDSFFNETTGYGATKTIWVLTPVMFCVLLIEVSRTVLSEQSKEIQDASVIGLSLVLVFAGIPQSVIQAISAYSSDRVGEVAVLDELYSWDLGYFDAQTRLDELPVACVEWDALQERPRQGTQGYRCSTFLSALAAPRSCQGGQECDAVLTPLRSSHAFRRFGNREISLSQALAAMSDTGFDPRRAILLIRHDGAVMEEVPLRMFVERVVKSS